MTGVVRFTLKEASGLADDGFTDTPSDKDVSPEEEEERKYALKIVDKALEETFEEGSIVMAWQIHQVLGPEIHKYEAELATK